MKAASCIAAALLCAASPALATGTLLCRSTVSPGQGPELSLVIGPTGVAQAHFAFGEERFTTGVGTDAPVIAQSWLDRDLLKLDIMDANVETRIIRLDTERRGGSAYLGTLVHRGRTWRVRCSEEG